MKRLNLFKRFLGVILCLSVGHGAVFQISAQTRRNASPKPAANQTVSEKQSAAKCSGGWSGVVSFKKILKDSLESDEPGIRKATDRIKHKTSRDYDYTAKAVIDASANPQNPVVTTNVNFTDKDKSWGEERVWDTCNSRESGHWFIIENTDDRVTEAKATGSAKSFGLIVDETGGTYSFNLAFPNADGTYKREEKMRRSGHCQAKNNEPWDRNTNNPTKIEGESFSIQMEKIDPNNPDTISGTKIWGDNGTGKVRTFIYQATWTFTRCPGKLLITDLRFEHPKFPNWEDWREIVEQTGTVDGNPVKVKAKVLNLSSEPKFVEVFFKETYKGDKWDGAKPDLPLNNNTFSLRLDPFEEREVETIWNTEGYAWFDDGRPRLVQRVKAEAWENYKKQHEMTKNLKIAPKPIVFVPGIWTRAADFELYQNLLTVTHSYGWKTYQVTDTSGLGTISTDGTIKQPKANKSVYDNADNLTKYVDHVRTGANAWHVDMLAHSTGGLVARLYIHKQMEILPNDRPVVKHLMMLGVPNNGASCSNLMEDNDVLKHNTQTVNEVTPEEVKIFNQYVTNRKGTKFSALAGNSFPVLCAGPEWNDGYVGVESAKYGVTDFALTKARHPDLISTKSFNDFVKPHIVTGPRGTYPLPVVSEKGGNDGRNAAGN